MNLFIYLTTNSELIIMGRYNLKSKHPCHLYALLSTKGVGGKILEYAG